MSDVEHAMVLIRGFVMSLVIGLAACCVYAAYTIYLNWSETGWQVMLLLGAVILMYALGRLDTKYEILLYLENRFLQ